MAVTNNASVRDVLNQIVHDPRYPDVMEVPVCCRALKVDQEIGVLRAEN